jgi:hypothetical protein
MAWADLTLNDGGTHDIDIGYPGNPISGDLNVYDGSGPTTTTVNLLPGGSIEEVLYAHDTSLINIDGGAIGQLLTVDDTSLVNINSGSIGASGPPTTGILSFRNSTVNIYGGSITGDLIVPSASSTINIYGVGFNYPYGAVPDLAGIITGTLHMGDSLSLDFECADYSNIILHEMAVVPAPGAALLGILGLVSASWRLRKQRTV